MAKTANPAYLHGTCSLVIHARQTAVRRVKAAIVLPQHEEMILLSLSTAKNK